MSIYSAANRIPERTARGGCGACRRAARVLAPENESSFVPVGQSLRYEETAKAGSCSACRGCVRGGCGVLAAKKGLAASHARAGIAVLHAPGVSMPGVEAMTRGRSWAGRLLWPQEEE